MSALSTIREINHCQLDRESVHLLEDVGTVVVIKWSIDGATAATTQLLGLLN